MTGKTIFVTVFILTMGNAFLTNKSVRIQLDTVINFGCKVLTGILFVDTLAAKQAITQYISVKKEFVANASQKPAKSAHKNVRFFFQIATIQALL